MNRFVGPIAAVALTGLCAWPATAEDKDTRLAAGVQDNSCLVEEAYNQEARLEAWREMDPRLVEAEGAELKPTKTWRPLPKGWKTGDPLPEQ
jgi:hypothetical protein